FGSEINARQLVGIERQQALVTQIFRRLIEAGFRVACDCEYSRVIFQFRERPRTRGSVIADEQGLSLSILAGDSDLFARSRESVRRQVGSLVLYQAIRSQRRKRGNQRTDRILIGGQGLGLE